ncbi:hypothetical protein HpHNI93_08650 [Helicobacter pylori]
MFEMATGSGKTLVMAGLILECYKQGYQNFIFFVNSTSILEKTKLNFTDSVSSKYLFSENISINDENTEIKSINNLNEFILAPFKACFHYSLKLKKTLSA